MDWFSGYLQYQLTTESEVRMITSLTPEQAQKALDNYPQGEIKWAVYHPSVLCMQQSY